MLPNHQPLVIAEQFGTLDALHPGRIDLGIGRAPGTDPRTARALRRGTDPLGADDFPEQLTELLAYFHGDGPVLAVPAAGPGARAVAARARAATAPRSPGCWGCRSRSPTTSAARTRDAALALYRQTFRPSAVLEQPYAMICAAVLARRDRRRGPTARAAVGPAVPAAAARHARARCPRPRRPPPTRTPTRSGRSSSTGWRARSSGRPRRCATACGSWSSARGSTS